MEYIAFFDAYAASLPALNPLLRSDLRRFLRKEGIVRYQAASKECFDRTLTSLATNGAVENVLFHGRTYLVVGMAPSDLLDFLGVFNKLQVDGVEGSDSWDEFVSRSEQTSRFASVEWDSIYRKTRHFDIWLRRLLGPAPRVLFCRHGPGATAERLIGVDKWLAMDPAFNDAKSIRFCSVPKDISGRRLIGIEPAYSQFLQQGCANALRATRFFRKYVNLRDVSRHVRLARATEMTTIDLKDASDRIPLSLVDWLLPADWSELFHRFSTACGELPDGRRISLGMMATMGNGFCFELETLVFFLVSLLVCAAEHESVTGCRPNYSRLASNISVYGDDIVIPRYRLGAISHAFAQTGFVLNPKKTCLTRRFKETCGYWIWESDSGTHADLRVLPRLRGDSCGLLFDSDAQILGLVEQMANARRWHLADELFKSLAKRPLIWDDKSQVISVLSRVVSSKMRQVRVPEETRYLSYWKTGSSTPTQEEIGESRSTMFVPVSGVERAAFLRFYGRAAWASRLRRCTRIPDSVLPFWADGPGCTARKVG